MWCVQGVCLGGHASKEHREAPEATRCDGIDVLILPRRGVLGRQFVPKIPLLSRHCGQGSWGAGEGVKRTASILCILCILWVPGSRVSGLGTPPAVGSRPGPCTAGNLGLGRVSGSGGKLEGWIAGLCSSRLLIWVCRAQRAGRVRALEMGELWDGIH